LANGLLKNPQSIQVTPRNTTVERIAQVIHPVGRDKKKDLLAHLIAQNNWSQVLVFTRTKFGANGVADFLNQQGISAMALHGNKSQTARTQALAGFKSGELRALVATDIAARGIDIDELPHVVNFDIPNISEDYVHRIGRTGRAGASGEAVSFVSLDEEGFMQDIERFTNQKVPVVVVEGFAPSADEKAEPIAMGRQTLWGGLGKPPSREVMAAAAKAARAEMMQRIRENKGTQGQRGQRNNAQGGEARAPRPNSQVGSPRDRQQERPTARVQPSGRRHRPNGPGQGQGQGQGQRQEGFNANAQRPPRHNDSRQGQPRQQQNAAPQFPRHDDDEDFFQPRANAHLGTQSGVNAFGHKNKGGGGRQPDPTMTSIDLMSHRKPGGGGFGGGGNRRNQGRGNGGSNAGGGGRRGGGGFNR
jgi:ATP-dependent RNA helicase RhlE